VSTLTIAAAQTISIAGDLSGNITRHSHFIEMAAEQGVQLLVFPELSLTGYEGEVAAALAVAPQDGVLQPLRDLARELGVTAVVGIPIRLEDSNSVRIGALVLGADGSLGVYSKQHLHAGEELVFAPGFGGPCLNIGERSGRAGSVRRFLPCQPCCCGRRSGRRLVRGRRIDQRKRLRGSTQRYFRATPGNTRWLC
jgi:predicted amidohydrolase